MLFRKLLAPVLKQSPRRLSDRGESDANIGHPSAIVFVQASSY